MLRKMMDIIFYGFYGLSVYGENKWEKELQMPLSGATDVFALFQAFNIFTLNIFLSKLFPKSIKVVIDVNIGVILLFILFLLNYLYFVRSKRYIKIIEKYYGVKEKKHFIYTDRKTALRNKIIFIAYIIFTIWSFIAVLQ